MNQPLKSLLPFAFLFFLFSCNQPEKREAIVDVQKNAGNTVQYTSCKIKLTKNAIYPNTNEKVNFQLKPIAQPGNVTAKLETVHEKKIHFIVVSDDLSYFDHLHSDADSAGSYNFETSFPSPGTYIFFADYKAQGLPAAIDTFHFSVAGKHEPRKYTTPQLTTSVDGYDLQLLTKKVYPLSQSQLILKIKKDGADVSPDQLQPYLGERSHFIAINTITKEFIHAHAMNDQMSYWYMLTLPRAGFYKAWVQFKTNDIVHTAVFVLEAVNTK